VKARQPTVAGRAAPVGEARVPLDVVRELQRLAATRARVRRAQRAALLPGGGGDDVEERPHGGAVQQKALGPAHPEVATTLNNLGRLYYTQCYTLKAEPLYRRALPIQEKVFGVDHPEVAVTLNNLALLYKFQGRYADAEPFFIRSLAIREKFFGQENQEVAVSLMNLADLYASEGRYAEAAPLTRRSLAMRMYQSLNILTAQQPADLVRQLLEVERLGQEIFYFSFKNSRFQVFLAIAAGDQDLDAGMELF